MLRPDSRVICHRGSPSNSATIPIFFIAFVDLIFQLARASCREHIVDLPKAHGLFCEAKGAVLSHLPGGAKKGTKRGAR